MSSPDIAEQIKQVPLEVRPIVQAARSVVRAVAPKAEEIAYNSKPPQSKTYMWKLVRYAVNGKNVVGIGTFPKHSSLFFYRGRELDDGSGVLQGGGKDSRFLTLRSASDAKRAEVKRLIQNAFSLERSPISR
jgi:hypothetical protein